MAELPEELNLLLNIIKRRVEDEKKKIPKEIKITEEMKEAIETNYNSFFSPFMPYRFCYMGTVANSIPDVTPVSFAKVIEDDKILIADIGFLRAMENLKINPRASLVSVFYNIFEFQGGTLILKTMNTDKMKGWQLKGTIKVYKEGEYFEEANQLIRNLGNLNSALVLEVDEIYCAVTGKKLQEKIERFLYKLLTYIIKFFYDISGQVAISLANNVLKRYSLYMNRNMEIEGAISEKKFEEALHSLLKGYSKVYGEPLTKDLPQRLEETMETLRTTWIELLNVRKISKK
ncbi:MAG TPA: pyridoxamine 5'-phosphate oxidase family protein [archaeon]|nr:pyridoxamine 5'-phosphate oxidase family protein [archaeon]